MMPDKKRKRGRPRVAPVLSYGSELKLRNNITRNIKKPRYLRDQDEEDSMSRGSTPTRSLDNVSLHSKSSANGKSRNGRGYNTEIDDKDSEYHYGSDFDMEEDSDIDKYNQAPDSRSISEATSDLEESDLGDLNIDEGETLGPTSEAPPSFVPFWKLGPAGTLGHRPQTPIPVWLQDRKFPPLELPSPSDDLLMPLPYVLQAVGIYEVLRHFRNIARLSPFHFEDFCACLLSEELTILLSEIHMSLIKALIREEEAQQTHYGQLDQKDSINIALYFVDSMTWPETLKVYLQSDSKEFGSTLEVLDVCNYPYTTLSNRLKVLQFLCDQFLQTSPVREDLLSEGKIRYDDHCRACHKTGDLLCCDSCPAVYHLDCADPPLSNVPLEIEDWTCTVCNKHKLEGVTDCSSLTETSVMINRQEPIGFDRHGRKYWFLVRRIIVESEEGEIWYYSTLEQLDLLMLLLDSEDLEEALYVALKEFGDDIRRQMEITEKITERARGSRRAAITLQMEETRKEIEKIQEKKENSKKNEDTEELKDIIEEVKMGGGGGDPFKESDNIKVEVKEEAVDEEGNLNEEKRLKGDAKINFKYNIKEMDEVKKEKVYSDEEMAQMIEEKMEQLRMPKGVLFRLGCDLGCRTYVNHFVSNILALNKIQHNEERDKKRHLSHKFSLTSNSDFKWQGQCHGSSDNQMANVRQTILSLEQNISSHFFHPNWQHVRKFWIQFVGSASTASQFGKALLWLVTCIKPVVYTTVWHESLGHIRLKRITLLDREERKKQEKRERREAEDESKLFPLVKFTKGVKHQLWKMKGEEYRIHGLWGWRWLSVNRKVCYIPMSTVGLKAGPEKITIPIKSNGDGGGLIRGLPISAASYYQLAAKTPPLQFSLLSPKQKREEEEEESKTETEKKKKEIMLANAGQFEVSPIDLENYFDDGTINVSNELNSRLRLVYPKLTKGSSFLDGLLPRRLTLKIQEERDIAKNKKSQKDKKENEMESHVDIENDSDSSISDDNNNNNNNDGIYEESVEESIEEIPDSQRRVAIHKLRPAGHLLKEMRMHKFKYEALDKMDETLPCYSSSCRKGGRSMCYSPSCILKTKTKQKLVNSVSNYKIITSKPAPFDNIGSCSPVRLNEDTEQFLIKKSEATISSQSLNKSLASNGQNVQFPVMEDKEKPFPKLSLDEDSSHSQGSFSSDPKIGYKDEKVFSSENTAGKIYLKKPTDTKKQKKHKIPPINYFRVFNQSKKEEENNKLQINKRSLFVLPKWELSIMARKGGKYCPNGFNLNAKVNQHFWPYPCPRPVFKITWLYRTTLVNSINAVAYQLRILWTCLKWDEMHEKGPADGRKQIASDIEIIQTEILKRKITGRFHEKTNYLRRKVTIPLDVPKPVREFTPSQRSGLRKRRRAHSPVNQQPQSVEEWVIEDKVDLWEIRYFGERLEKAASLSKKSDKGDGSFASISRSTSPSEFKARMEEQLKIQRANFNQKKSVENQTNATSNKGVVKVAIGSAVTGGSSGSKLTFTNSGRLIQTPSIVTMGSKLPSVLAGKKIVTTKGGKIITVQTSGGGIAINQPNDNSSKLSVNKSSIFPVSSLPKVQVTPQGNKVIKLQNINTAGQRAILPRVVTSQNSSQTSIIRPFTTSTTTTQTFQPISTSTPISGGIRPVVSSQQIQIFRMPDGQFQVKGLQEGQQLLQRGDGKLQVVNTKIAGNAVTSNVSSSNSIQVTQQTKPASVLGKDSQVRGIGPLSGNQILRINGQQVILRTSSTASNGKTLTAVNAKDASLTTGNVSIPKIKTSDEPNPKLSPITPNQLNLPSPVKNQPNIIEETPKLPLVSTPPPSPSNGTMNSSAGVPNTMTLRVQVRMTEQGPKTIIQGLQPGVGLTKDHIMAIQQQVRSMLAQYNLQVNQLSPLMTLTLQSTNKNQQSSKVTNSVQQTSLPSANQASLPLKSVMSSERETSVINNQTSLEKDKGVDVLGLKDNISKENSQSKFSLTDDYIQQSIQNALSKNDLTPDVEEKLIQFQKFTKTKKSPDLTPTSKGSKRLREDESDWESSDVTPIKGKLNKRAKSEKRLKKDGLTSTSPISAVPSTTSTSPATSVSTYGGTKTVLQDARKKLARQQKLEGMLTKHKDLLKKDILKKRALLEKELQLQIHKELSLARQQIQSFEKMKNVEPVNISPSKKSKHDSTPAQLTHSSHSKETTKAKKVETHSAAVLNTSGPSAFKSNAKNTSRTNKKSNKTKSKKIVCICRTFFDDTKFYVGCDLCGNWFHGDCVGITEALSRSMTEYVCDDCANAKLNKDLFCFCRQPYDETQFYICCEKCEDWYHGKCVGIMQAEADDIDDYICPKCEPDNRWNRPCQKKLTDKDYAELKKVAKLLIQHKNAWPFLEPVDQSEVPDYYKVVKQPMDLKAVERKVQQRKYKNLYEFVGDVMLVFDNCRAYNPPNSSFFSCANNLEGFFCMKLKQLKLKIGQKS